MLKLVENICKKIVRESTSKEIRDWPPICAAIFYQAERPTSKPDDNHLEHQAHCE
jgi:hypothetical protein